MWSRKCDSCLLFVSFIRADLYLQKTLGSGIRDRFLQRVRFFKRDGCSAVTGESRESKVVKADDALSLSVQASNKYSEEQKKCKSKMERLVRIFCGGGDR